jgi:hypothetical protein
LDSDNDGIADVVEAGGTDANGDGRADNFVDADRDGYNDVVDGDPTNALAVGSDAAGANTGDALVLTGADTNGDGVPNSYPTDDNDRDGVLNFLDLDSDNDGIADVVEAGGTDANGDGRADNFVDADRDGYNDVVDGDPTNALAVGSDAAGANTGDALVLTGADTNGDGVPNSYPTDDNDRDGVLNFLDLDSDNDGVADVVEAGGTDANGDGRADNFVDVDRDGYNDVVDGDPTNALAVGSDAAGANTGDALVLTGPDTNGDGVPNSYPTDDFDGDRILNFLDLDSDNDGVADVVETAGLDADNNGIADNYVDTDGDGFNDDVDGDVGNDGVAENTASAQVRTGNDANGDGRPDNYPTDDADRDGHLNFLDLDADNDGITDVVENNSGLPTTGATSDAPTGGSFDGFVGDGTITDSNNNGWHDAAEGVRPIDSDGDGILDIYDIDADNDGIADYVEATCSACPTFSINVPAGTDANNNGVLDQFEAINNANGVGGVNVGLNPNEDDNDGAGPPDYLDTDTDNDGGMDWAEGFDNGFGGATAGDGNAALEIINMANYFATQYELIFATPCGCYPNIDSDNDGLPAWLDSDDNVAGYDRAIQPPFLNPASIYWRDEDNDGLADIFDQLIFTTSVGSFSTVPDADNINDRDWRDVASIITFPVQLIVFDAHRVTYNDVKLNWTTATELNNEGFDVERMLSNETEFTKIGFMQGAGTTTNITNYEYHDANSHSSTSYYRLRQIDADGNSVYSVIRAVEGQDEAQKATILLYPNPATNFVNIRFGDIQANTAVTVRLIDMKGVALQNHESRVSTFDILTLDIQNLVPASYVLDIQFANGEKTVLKFVKQ